MSRNISPRRNYKKVDTCKLYMDRNIGLRRNYRKVGTHINI
jgi:hypothetical protein